MAFEYNFLALLAAELDPDGADPRDLEILRAARETRGDHAALRRRVREIDERYPSSHER